MNLYAESSAVLTWMLNQAQASVVRDVLAAADDIITSELTLLEYDRALIRLASWDEVSDEQAEQAGTLFRTAVEHWTVIWLERPILRRARQPFPMEPIRSLDAIHLATALAAREDMPGLVLLSLDDRVRASATGLGFDVLPEAGG